MNASYRLNTCKSRGSTGVAIPWVATGARVSNAYPTWPIVGNSPAKVGLMPYVFLSEHFMRNKDLSLWDGDASD